MSEADRLAVSVPVATVWRSPSAVRYVDKPAIVDAPDPRAWPDALDKQSRLELLGRVDTQLLLGEPVEVIDEDADWLKIVAPWQPSSLDVRGYPGWVRRSHVAEAPLATDDHVVICVDTTRLSFDNNVPDAEATYGTILPTMDVSDGMIQVALPGGATAWVSRSACREHRGLRPVATAHLDGEVAVSSASRFIGLQYVWGGTCAYALDCSGMVHLVLRALGVLLPRDAHDQAEVAEHFPRSEAQTGDLLFFAEPGKPIHHVGFAVGDGEHLLHAPGTGNVIADEPLPTHRRNTVLDFVTRLPTP